MHRAGEPDVKVLSLEPTDDLRERILERLTPGRVGDLLNEAREGGGGVEVCEISGRVFELAADGDRLGARPVRLIEQSLEPRGPVCGVAGRSAISGDTRARSPSTAERTILRSSSAARSSSDSASSALSAASAEPRVCSSSAQAISTSACALPAARPERGRVRRRGHRREARRVPSASGLVARRAIRRSRSASGARWH